MTIVAMGREMGSRGKAVAEGVAAGLDASVVHYEIIDHLGDRTRIRKSHVVRLLEEGDDLERPLTPEDTLPTILSATEILDIASIPESVVLRGWGGVALLRGILHVVRVRITAPLETRVRNLMASVKQPNEERIREEIRLFDEAHAAVMRRHFGVDYRDPSLYDLVLDTSELEPAECARCIIDFARDQRFLETRALLKLHPPTRNLEIGVVARQGMVALTGQVASEELKARCEQVARRVPGIDTVLNELRVVA
jgi:hypothetical protein